MPPAARRWLGWLSLLSTLWVAGWAAAVWHTRRTPEPFRRIDHHLIATGPSVHRLAGWFADLGDADRFAAILVVVAVLCLLGRSWRALLGALVSLGVVLVLVEVVLKPLVDARLRPFVPASYPSGHTATACCLATVAVLLLGRRRGPLRLPVPLPLRAAIIVLGVAIGPVVGLSMVVVAAHSIIDVIGAAPLGVTTTLLVCAGVDRICGPGRGRAVRAG